MAHEVAAAEAGAAEYDEAEEDAEDGPGAQRELAVPPRERRIVMVQKVIHGRSPARVGLLGGRPEPFLLKVVQQSRAVCASLLQETDSAEVLT